jgi:large subunit ribosomal protein L22e|mmetsp:Transcript_1917/g.6394  ORF Transcript_1917/g.6394 Transcript_1917/m.6394 type:complete len:91 (+) Transcript_1917:380-652(+)
MQEQFLVSHIKVDNKTGNLGNSVTVTRDADKLIVDINSTQLPKRYIKYLTKKYLKRHDLAELLRPVATAKDTYMLRYYYYENEEDKEEEE